MTRMPTIFFGHGNPTTNALAENDWTRGWAALGRSLPRPRALFDFRNSAPGDPVLAERVCALWADIGVMRGSEVLGLQTCSVNAEDSDEESSSDAWKGRVRGRMVANPPTDSRARGMDDRRVGRANVPGKRPHDDITTGKHSLAAICSNERC